MCLHYMLKPEHVTEFRTSQGESEYAQNNERNSRNMQKIWDIRNKTCGRCINVRPQELNTTFPEYLTFSLWHGIPNRKTKTWRNICKLTLVFGRYIKILSHGAHAPREKRSMVNLLYFRGGDVDLFDLPVTSSCFLPTRFPTYSCTWVDQITRKSMFRIASAEG